jgi:hypothetical protein
MERNEYTPNVPTSIPTIIESVALDNCNKPTIAIRNCFVKLDDITVRHSTKGTNLWGGNCAICCDAGGLLEATNLDISSITGRGICAIHAGSVTATSSVIHHCAATGVYVGDTGTFCTMSSCDILSNGNGSPPRERADDDEEAAEEPEVRSGHSGVYCESAAMIVVDCCISVNCTTGLSVVRGGKLSVKDSDIGSNGGLSMTMEDPEQSEVISDNNNCNDGYVMRRRVQSAAVGEEQ